MGAKATRKGTKSPSPPAGREEPAGVENPSETPPANWIESTDPKKRLAGRIALAAVWLYVAALWLLALDQTFHWGIFGPKLPPGAS